MRTILCFLSILLLNGCVTFSEKNSEVLSVAVYATKDSIDNSRIDLAEKYSNEATRLVKPPKKRVEVKPIIEKKEKKTIVPFSYKNDEVIAFGSERYDLLLKNIEINKQLESDKIALQNTIKDVDKELSEQYRINNEMILKINSQKEEILKKEKIIVQKDLQIVRMWIFITSLIVAICVYGYFAIKRKLILPI
jgi:hypothetical protein